jgi:hypothetical protein
VFSVRGDVRERSWHVGLLLLKIDRHGRPFVPAIHCRDVDGVACWKSTAAMDGRYGLRFAPARPAMTVETESKNGCARFCGMSIAGLRVSMCNSCALREEPIAPQYGACTVGSMAGF